MRKAALIPSLLVLCAMFVSGELGRSGWQEGARGAPPETVEAVFRAYLDALNRQDVEGVLRLYAPGFVFRRLGEEVKRTSAQLRDIREWEVPMQAHFEFEVVSVKEEWLTARFLENNLLYDTLQIRRPMVVEYRIRDGLIHEVHLKEIREEARPWPRALAEFEQWLAQKSAAQTAGLVRDGKLLFTGDAARRLVPHLDEWREAAANARAQNEAIYRSLIEALNQHDVDAQYRHYAPAMFYHDEGRRIVPNKESERSDREFESANNAVWSYRVLGAGLDSLDLLITEDMEYYQLLGAGARSHRACFRFGDGKIVEAEAWDWTQTGKQYEQTRDAFIQWLLRERPDAAAEITKDGRLRFINAAAPRINQMVREWRARTTLQASADALGGAGRLAQAVSWYVEGRGRENPTAQLQGIRADQPTWRPHEEKFAVDTRTMSVSWDRRTPRNDGSLRWRRMIYKPDTFGVVDWNGDWGAVRASQTPEPRRRALARRVPHLLVLEAATRAGAVRWLREREIEGTPHDEVEVILADDVTLQLTLAREPAVLRRVEYRTHMPGKGDVAVSWEWNGWKPDTQLGHVPSDHRVTIAGDAFQEVTYSQYGLASPAAAELLEVPARFLSPRATVQGPSSVASDPPLPATGMVAPGVMVADVRGFRVMFVEFRDFVVAFDAPETDPGFDAIPSAGSRGEATGEYLALIQRTFPGKPVRHAVLSHHHGDHMGGMRAFAAAGATLLVAPADRDVVLRLLAAPHTIAPDAWQGPSHEAKIETVADRRVITDGARSVEVLNVGDNPHTAENLLLWLPAERILMQGDLFYYDYGRTFPPRGRETMNRFFSRWLVERNVRPRAIYGVHNDGAAGPEWLTETATLLPPAKTPQ